MLKFQTKKKRYDECAANILISFDHFRAKYDLKMFEFSVFFTVIKTLIFNFKS